MASFYEKYLSPFIPDPIEDFFSQTPEEAYEDVKEFGGEVGTNMLEGIKFAATPIGDIGSVIDQTLETFQKIGYQAFGGEKILEKSYDELMYPGFGSIDEEIAFLEDATKFRKAGMAPYLGAPSDIAGGAFSLGEGQLGHSVEFMRDALIFTGGAKLLKDQKRLKLLKDRKKAININKRQINIATNVIKKQVKRDYKTALKIEARKNARLGINKKDIRIGLGNADEVVEQIANDVLKNTKFHEIMGKHGFLHVDDLAKLGRKGKSLSAKFNQKVLKEPYFAGDVNKFLKNNIPLYKKGTSAARYGMDVLKQHKIGKGLSKGMSYLSPRKLPNLALGLVTADVLGRGYMGATYGKEGLYDYSSDSLAKDLIFGGLPAAVFDIAQRAGSMEAGEGTLSPTSVRQYLNKKKEEKVVAAEQEDKRETIQENETGAEAAVPAKISQAALADTSLFATELSKTYNVKQDSIMKNIRKLEDFIDKDKDIDPLLKAQPYLKDYLEVYGY